MSSYPGFPNYSPYQYGSGVSEQDTTPQYLPRASPSSLQSSTRGYSASAYDWQGQTTQETSVKDGRPLGDRWKYPSNQNAYSYPNPPQRRPGNEKQSINPLSYTRPPVPLRQPQPALDTPSLHSLAYASGLESELLNRQTHSSSTAKTIDTVRQSVSRPVPPLKSPELGRPYPSTTPSAASGRSQSSQPFLAPSATAALPPRSYSSSGQVAPNSSTYSQSVYVPVSKSSSASQLPANNSPVPRTSTSYSSQYTWSQAMHTASRDGSGTLSSSQGQNTYQPPPSAVTSTTYNVSNDPTPATTNGYISNGTGYDTTNKQSHHVNGMLSSSQQTSAISTHQTQDTIKYPSVPVDTLYNNPDSGHSLAEETWSSDRFPDQQSPSSSMPSYIDPTQVYNPYRQEYEQMKALQAEAEAKRQQEQADKKAKELDASADPSVASNADAHGNTSEASVSGSHSVASDSQPNKKKPRKRGPRKSAPAGPPAPPAPDGTSINTAEENADGDMANEMKMMIEKMRQWRSKDPTLFAKLWDDVRKGQTSNNAPAPETPQQTVERAATPSTVPVASKWNAAQSDKKTLPSHYIDGLPDLGRFPAQRRRRQSHKSKGNDTPNSKEKSDGNTQQTEPNTLPSEMQPVTATLGAQLAQSQQMSQSQPTETSELTTTAPRTPEVMSLSQPAVPSTLQIPSKQPVEEPAQKNAPQPPQQSTTGTVWPEHKRQAVAQALIQYLDSIPANRGRSSSVEEMSSMIDKNPSYIELCERIESRGFTLNRGNLARFLLSSVPDLKSPATATQQHKPDPNSRVTPLPPPPPSPPAPPAPPAAVNNVPLQSLPQSAPQAHMIVWNLNAPSVQTHPGHPQPLPPVAIQYQQPPAVTTRVINTKKSKSAPPPPPGPPPGPKEQKSRKHLFSEIVDLSALSDDEDEDMRRAGKEPRLDSINPSLGPQSDVTIAKAQNQPQLETSETFQQPPDAPAPAQQGISEPASHVGFSRFAMAGDDGAKREALRRRADIVKPINKMEALRRKYYNPKTIARDVLIAAGRHPTERPLNNHLQGLQEVFAAVDLTSDMGTFRWDLADPGGPPAPVVEPEEILLLPPTFSLGVRSKSATSTSREDRDAGSSDRRPASPANFTSQLPHKPSNLSFSQSIHDFSPTTPNSKGDTAMSTPVPRRRGRPPGAKNKKPTKAALRAAKVEIKVPIESSPPHYSVYHCEWESCEAELHDLKTFERHLNKVHAPGTLICAWSKCPAGKTPFPNNEELRQHLKQVHVASLAWQLGDGPSVGRTVLVKDFLHGPHGFSMTPEASDAQKNGETGAIVFPTGYTPIRAFNLVRGNASLQQKAREAYRAVEQRIIRIGIALEPVGCELANLDRLWAVSNDEDYIQLKPPGRRNVRHLSVS